MDRWDTDQPGRADHLHDRDQRDRATADGFDTLAETAHRATRQTRSERVLTGTQDTITHNSDKVHRDPSQTLPSKHANGGAN
jgi:hypothetical protein